MTGENTLQPDLPVTPEMVTQAFTAQPILAAIEGDRFCRGCGYNLRGQPVRREPLTRVLLARCPECGIFEPGNEPHPWTGRLSKLLIILYLLLLLASLLAAMAIQFLVAMMTSAVVIAFLDDWRPGGRAMLGMVLVLMLAALVVAILSGVVCSLAMAVAPRVSSAGHVVFMVIWPLPPLGFAASLLMSFATMARSNDMLRLAPIICTCLAVASVAGGQVAWLMGRGPVRLLVRLVLPPRWRGYVGYLWRVDGLDVPAMDTQA